MSKEKYRKDTGKNPYTENEHTNHYVEWLEKENEELKQFSKNQTDEINVRLKEINKKWKESESQLTESKKENEELKAGISEISDVVADDMENFADWWDDLDEEGKAKYLEEHPGSDKGGGGGGVGESEESSLERSTFGEMGLSKYLVKEEEKEFDGSEEWKSKHKARTSGGSHIIGTPHSPELEEGRELDYIKNLLPEVTKIAEEAIKAGKKVVFLGEGSAYEPEYNDAWNEQSLVAKHLRDKFKDKVEQGTWDDDNVRVHSHEDGGKSSIDVNSVINKKMAKKFGKPEGIEAAMYSFMAGQGDDLAEPSDEAKKIFKEEGIDWKDTDAMYRASFPEDFSGDKENKFSTVAKEYNRLRQENLIKKMKDIEKDGGVAIVTPGASHAFELKDVAEKHWDRIIPSEI